MSNSRKFLFSPMTFALQTTENCKQKFFIQGSNKNASIFSRLTIKSPFFDRYITRPPRITSQLGKIIKINVPNEYVAARNYLRCRLRDNFDTTSLNSKIQ